MVRDETSIEDQVADEVRRRLELMHQRRRARFGRTMLTAGQLPRGNYYCQICCHPEFVVPKKGIAVEIPDQCKNCRFLIRAGFMVEGR